MKGASHDDSRRRRRRRRSETTLEVGKGEGKVGEMGSRSGGEMKEAGSRERGVDEGH